MARDWATVVGIIVVLLGAYTCGLSKNAPSIDDTPSKTNEAPIAIGTVVIDEGYDTCGSGFMESPDDYHDQFLDWTADGSQIVFSYREAMWVVDSGGTQIRRIAWASLRRLSPDNATFGFHADVSPIGSQVVYANCEYSSNEYRGTKVPYASYEIAVTELEGSDKWQLTDNGVRELYPVWSPDGTRIAFIRSSSGLYPHDDGQLYTMSADGADVRAVVPTLSGLALAPPVWSPNGERLAILVGEVIEAEIPRYRNILYTVRADGTELTRIADTARALRDKDLRNRTLTSPTLPAWSPDGRYLAFVMAGEKRGVYTVRPDGSELKKVLADFGGPVLWSPDGEEIFVRKAFFFVPPAWKKGEVYIGGELYAVRPDGSGLRQVSRFGSRLGAWSPDGKRIALYSGEGFLATVAPDGTDRRDLIRVDDEGNLMPANPHQEAP